MADSLSHESQSFCINEHLFQVACLPDEKPRILYFLNNLFWRLLIPGIEASTWHVLRNVLPPSHIHSLFLSVANLCFNVVINNLIWKKYSMVRISVLAFSNWFFCSPHLLQSWLTGSCHFFLSTGASFGCLDLPTCCPRLISSSPALLP